MNAAAYRVLAQAFAPAVLGYLWWRSRREPAYREQIPERLGRLTAPSSGASPIWVHAASMGEVRAVAPLIRALLKAGEPVHLTTNTPAGRDTAVSVFADRVGISYAPLDTPSAINRFLDQLNPKAAVFVELELWPQRFLALAQRGIPTAIVNARLSERSLRRYQRLGRVLQDALQAVATVAAQTAPDAERFQQLGVTASRLTVTGNLKFDQTLDAELVECGRELRARMGAERSVWVAASVREGEAETVIAAHQKLRRECPDALLILVPRHPQQFSLPTDAGDVLRWSAQTTVLDSTSVLLADVTGELPRFLAAADIAFVGGSLVDVGGHNPLEPASLGLPVLMGPSVTNFERVDALLAEAGARVQVKDAKTLADSLIALFADVARRETMGAKGRAVVADHQGACERTLDLLIKQVIHPH